MHDEGSDGPGDRAEVLDCLSDKSPIEDDAPITFPGCELLQEEMLVLIIKEAQIVRCQQ